MGFNLTGNEIKNTYPRLVTISGSIISNGTGSDISNLTITASNATSASYALTASFAQNVTPLNTGSFVVTASTSNATTTFTKGDGSTFSTTVNNVSNASTASIATSASFASTAATAVSATSASFAATASLLLGTIATASYALNAADSELLDGNDGTYYRDASNINAGTLSATRLSGGYTINVTGSLLGTASFATNAGSAGSSTSASFATNAGLLGGESGAFYRNANNINAGTLGSGRLSGTYTIDIAGNAATATSASFASTIASGININANNITASNALITNLVATSASIGYLKATTGSVVTIGSQFIVLNSDSPAARYAGIQVYDSGSGLTGSFEWDSVDDNWIQVATNGTTAGFLTGLSGSKGNEAYPANNTILKGTGNHTVQNSIITDNGSTVTVAGTVSASSFVGPLTGTASFATSASFATTAATATSASFAQTASFLLNNIPAFPFTGSAQITGSLGITSSFEVLAASTSRTYIRNAGTSGQKMVFNDIISSPIASGSNDDNFLVLLPPSTPNVTLYDQDVLIGGYSYAHNITGGGGGNFYLCHGTANEGISGFHALNNFFGVVRPELTSFGGGSYGNGFFGGETNRIRRVSGANILGGINNIITDTTNDNNRPAYQTIVGGNSNTISGSDSAVIIGGKSNIINYGQGDASLNTKLYSAIIASTGSVLNHSGSVILGGQGITSTQTNTVYVPNLDVSGSSTFKQLTVFSGSVRGEVRALTIASNTASLDCSLDNFFTLTLVSGSTTHVNPTNILPGQTINLLVNTTGSGLISFPSSVKQSTVYTPTTGSGTLGKDILTFISFDNTTLYMNNVKNLV